MSTSVATPRAAPPMAPSMAPSRQTLDSIVAAIDSSAPTGTRYYTWQIPVRLCHWLIAFSIVVLAATGIYLGRPFLVVPGEARFSFVMGYARAIHFYTAIIFSLAVLVRIVWMFLGNPFSRWTQFVPTTRERWTSMWRTFRFYTFIDRHAPHAPGHNPLAGFAYLGIFGLYLLEMATGFGLYASSAHVESPLRFFTFLVPILGGLQTMRLIHHVVMWMLLAFAVHHVYSAWLMDIDEKNGTMDSIFSGYRLWNGKLPGSEK